MQRKSNCHARRRAAVASQAATRREEILRGAARRKQKVNIGKSVGSFVPGLAQKAFEKFGFSTVALLTEWPAIVGQELAGYTRPERLKWPRKVSCSGDADSGFEGRPGATLVLRVEPSRALDVQYGTTQIIERINSYFGYRAVADLRLQQLSLDAGNRGASAPMPEKAEASGAAPSRASDDELLAGVVDDELRASLQRLQAGIVGH